MANKPKEDTKTMNETKEKKYLIVSMHCLENTDGYGTIRYLNKQIRNKMPLSAVQ